MDENGIDKMWLLSWECPQDEIDPQTMPKMHHFLHGEQYGPISFSRCVSYKERAPERFEIGFAPDPRKPQAMDKMEAAIDIYDAKICGELKLRMMYDNPDAIRLFKFCGKREIPVTVHIDYEIKVKNKFPRDNYWYGGGIETLERALAKCPNTIFLGHAPGFWSHISGDKKFAKITYPKGDVLPGGILPKLFRKHKNLYGDLSAGSGLNALSRDVSFAKEFIDEFQDRLLFARDSFDNAHYTFLKSLNLPRDIENKLFYGNALKLVP